MLGASEADPSRTRGQESCGGASSGHEAGKVDFSASADGEAWSKREHDVHTRAHEQDTFTQKRHDDHAYVCDAKCSAAKEACDHIEVADAADAQGLASSSSALVRDAVLCELQCKDEAAFDVKSTAVNPDPACFECGKQCKTFHDPDDDGHYCRECWTACYGEPPQTAPMTRRSTACKRTDSDWVAPASVLPDDAPRGHHAYVAVAFRGQNQNPRFNFKWRDSNQVVAFQTTVAAAGGSRQAAEVIARSCYMKFEQGWDKERVLAFRNQCYERVIRARSVQIRQEPSALQWTTNTGLADAVSMTATCCPKSASPGERSLHRDKESRNATADDPFVEKDGEVADLESARDVHAVSRKDVSMHQARTHAPCEHGAGPSKDEGMEALLPLDAPQGHAAFVAARCSSTHANPYVSFKWKGLASDTAVPFQTTVAACGGSRFAAEVIARACYVRFEQGWTKDQVLAFRNECYSRLRQARVGLPLRSAGGADAAAGAAVSASVAPPAAKRIRTATSAKAGAAPVQLASATAPAPTALMSAPLRLPPPCLHSSPSHAEATNSSVELTQNAWLPVQFLLSLLDDPSAPLPFEAFAAGPVTGSGKRGRCDVDEALASLSAGSTRAASAPLTSEEPFVMEEAWAREMAQLAQQIDLCEGRLSDARNRVKALDDVTAAGQHQQVLALREEVSEHEKASAKRKMQAEGQAQQLRDAIQEHFEAARRLEAELEKVRLETKRAEDSEQAVRLELERRVEEAKEAAVSQESRDLKAVFESLKEERGKLLAARTELASWKFGSGKSALV
eukprot:TRINITY_DN21605_c1_g1_i2.p1 TRINITY_DN21605_c1_g1~~TRINITY_DN21605_c1_g1_i2.p1  ORF type:complete len:793 (-),score=146.70 TRINITY_DN21605_c1_g1_i2:197-2575(-)